MPSYLWDPERLEPLARDENLILDEIRTSGVTRPYPFAAKMNWLCRWSTPRTRRPSDKIDHYRVERALKRLLASGIIECISSKDGQYLYVPQDSRKAEKICKQTNPALKIMQRAIYRNLRSYGYSKRDAQAYINFIEYTHRPERMFKIEAAHRREQQIREEGEQWGRAVRESVLASRGGSCLKS